MTNPTKSPSACRRVGIWIRVSTEDQAQSDSPEHHLERAREYARFNGWDVREVYNLAGVSGKTVMEHPETQRMLADIKRRHISTLIFSKLARLARNTKELLAFSDKFAEFGADMVSLHEKIDTSSPAGRLFYTIIAAMAQWESEEIGDRIKASIVTRAKMGKPLNGSSPYGFHWVDKKLTTHPKEAIIVKEVFELFRESRRKGAVARRLNDAGYRTRQGAKWRDSQVNRILREPAAAGTYVYNTTRRVGEWKYEAKPEDQWSKLSVPPIISEDLWHQVTMILGQQEKKFARPGRVPVRLFGGLTVCECGYRMYVPSGSRKYTCTKCKNKLLAEQLEKGFCKEMETFFASPQQIDKLFQVAKGKVDEKQARLANHRHEIRKVEDDLSRTHQLYLSNQIPLESFGTYHQPLSDRLRQLQDELARLEAELDHLKINDVSAEQVVHDARNISSRWPKMQAEEKRRIIQSMIERVTIGRGKIKIRYRSLGFYEESTKSQQLV